MKDTEPSPDQSVFEAPHDHFTALVVDRFAERLEVDPVKALEPVRGLPNEARVKRLSALILAEDTDLDLDRVAEMFGYSRKRLPQIFARVSYELAARPRLRAALAEIRDELSSERRRIAFPPADYNSDEHLQPEPENHDHFTALVIDQTAERLGADPQKVFTVTRGGTPETSTRQLSALILREDTELSLKQIAEALNYARGGLPRLFKNVSEELAGNPDLRITLAKVREALGSQRRRAASPQCDYDPSFSD